MWNDLWALAQQGDQGRHLEDVSVCADHQLIVGGRYKVIDPLGALGRLQVCKLEVGAKAAGLLGQALGARVPLCADHHTAARHRVLGMVVLEAQEAGASRDGGGGGGEGWVGGGGGFRTNPGSHSAMHMRWALHRRGEEEGGAARAGHIWVGQKG